MKTTATGILAALIVILGEVNDHLDDSLTTASSSTSSSPRLSLRGDSSRQPTASRPRDPMKILRQLATLILLGLAFAWVMSSCATVETRTTVTAPDGTVTVTESKTTAPDSASVAALSTTAQVFAPRAVIVRQEKAGTPADLQRILRGRPITREEIAARWKPATP